jgi:tRNA dimethylallyltransferase
MTCKTPIIIISGPTASGKTKLSLSLSKKYNGIAINADSVQVFTDLPILTAQPTLQERGNIPHKLFGYIESRDNIDTNIWINHALTAINETKFLKKVPFLVGGTGLYLKSLIDGISSITTIDHDVKAYSRNLFSQIGREAFYEQLLTLDPLIEGKINANDSQRMMRAFEVFLGTKKSIIEWQQMPKTLFFHSDSFLYIFITPKREVLYNNCNVRFIDMIDKGVIDEVQNVYNIVGNEKFSIDKAHGYKEIVHYLNKEWDLDTTIERSQTITRQYAKRQLTWFKHQVHKGHFIEYENFDHVIEKADKLISDFLKGF